MTPEHSELSSTVQLIIAVAATFAAQFVSRLYGNWKAEAEAARVMAAASSPEQVARLDVKVTELQAEMSVVKNQLAKLVGVAPDDRGPNAKTQERV